MCDNSGSISQKLDLQQSKIIAENQKYLVTILETLLFCAKQCIALRGHNENYQSDNQGNLLELLKMRSQDNSIFEKYFSNKEKIFRYVSPEYQNMFLNLLSNNILSQIIDLVKNAGIYSVIMDETQDLRKHEQVSIVLRYCDEKLNAFESFIGFYRTDKMDRESLSNLLKHTLLNLGLKLKNIRAQCYDGAASMRGSYSGVAKRIKDDNPLALYIHCYAHILNLCVVDVCEQVASVRNMFGILKSIYAFIGASSKRYSIFENIQNESKLPNITLKSLSDTMWNCRVEAIKSVLKNFECIISTLEHISDTDLVHGPEANSILKNIKDFEFIFCLNLMKLVLELTNSLSFYFQKKNINYSTVKSLTNTTVAQLKSLRSENNFKNVWSETNKVTTKENCPLPSVPRKRKIPARLGGGEPFNTDNLSEFVKINIYFTVLDIIITDIETKFSENNSNILNAVINVLTLQNCKYEDILEVSNTYNIEIDELQAELKLFGKMCFVKQTFDSFEDCLNYFILQDLSNSFENFYKLFKLFLSIPMSSASSERSFSSLRHLKTYTRNSIGQERLKGLALLHIEKKFEPKFDIIIDQFNAQSTIRGR